ncbi:hypothetical protein MTO96_036779 [Rhipicephalus appendiculatus]
MKPSHTCLLFLLLLVGFRCTVADETTPYRAKITGEVTQRTSTILPGLKYCVDVGFRCSFRRCCPPYGCEHPIYRCIVP